MVDTDNTAASELLAIYVSFPPPSLSASEKQAEELLYFLVFVEVKYHLDRTGMKNRWKLQKLHVLECGLGCTSWICKHCTNESDYLRTLPFLNATPLVCEQIPLPVRRFKVIFPSCEQHQSGQHLCKVGKSFNLSSFSSFNPPIQHSCSEVYTEHVGYFKKLVGLNDYASNLLCKESIAAGDDDLHLNLEPGSQLPDENGVGESSWSCLHELEEHNLKPF